MRLIEKTIWGEEDMEEGVEEVVVEVEGE